MRSTHRGISPDVRRPPRGAAVAPATPPAQAGRQSARLCRAGTPAPDTAAWTLTQIEGIDETTSLIIRSEMGLEMTRWPTVQHCHSWWGLCPHHRVAGGKGLRRRTTPCAHRAATALRRAAACSASQPERLRRLLPTDASPGGAPQALTATAHQLARLISTMLKHGTTSVRQGMDEEAQQYRDRTVKNVTRRAKTLGVYPGQSPRGWPWLTGTPGSSSLEGQEAHPPWPRSQPCAVP